MLGYNAIVHVYYLKILVFSFKAFEDLQIFQFSTPRSVSLRRVWLRAVLYCAESDSAQAYTARSQIFHEYLRKNEFLSKIILAC